ncbi:hypothetical protein HPB48_008220 [Haemaphysalis longicornis]|uniref:Uncharacterized protein n=1 Tax=Haemaphysalis longicornis TaxID=44386 RepID=A0A9J6GR25_HAELO|nr:hypothetical protein HPB48_008220 [Haemaphysalis longicornis]
MHCSSPEENDENNGPGDTSEPCAIPGVWASNLDEELHNHVAVDTEFPGVLVRHDKSELKLSVYKHPSVGDTENHPGGL